MTGVGVGAALVYLFHPAKKKPGSGRASHEAMPLASNVENVIDVSSHSFHSQSCLISAKALPSRAIPHRSASETIINGTFVKPVRTELLEKLKHLSAGAASIMRVAGVAGQWDSH